MKIYKKIR